MEKNQTNSKKHLPAWVGAFFVNKGEIQKRKSDSMGFSYKQQYAVVVICKDEKEQEDIYNRLHKEGYRLKVVAV